MIELKICIMTAARAGGANRMRRGIFCIRADGYPDWGGVGREGEGGSQEKTRFVSRATRRPPLPPKRCQKKNNLSQILKNKNHNWSLSLLFSLSSPLFFLLSLFSFVCFFSLTVTVTLLFVLFLHSLYTIVFFFSNLALRTPGKEKKVLFFPSSCLSVCLSVCLLSD